MTRRYRGFRRVGAAMMIASAAATASTDSSGGGAVFLTILARPGSPGAGRPAVRAAATSLHHARAQLGQS
jgi:hypothetical protein